MGSISYSLFPLVIKACKDCLQMSHLFSNSLSCQPMSPRRKALTEVKIPLKEVTEAREDQDTFIE